MIKMTKKVQPGLILKINEIDYNVSCNVPFCILSYAKLWSGVQSPFYRPRSEGDNVLGSVRPSVSERSHA